MPCYHQAACWVACSASSSPSPLHCWLSCAACSPSATPQPPLATRCPHLPPPPHTHTHLIHPPTPPLIPRQGFHFGAKLVRGAYMVIERARAVERDYPSPILDTKADTDASYDRCGAELPVLLPLAVFSNDKWRPLSRCTI